LTTNERLVRLHGSDMDDLLADRDRTTIVKQVEPVVNEKEPG